MMDLEKLQEVMSEYPEFRLKQVKKHLYQELISNWNDSTVLPVKLKERLNKDLPIDRQVESIMSKEKDAIKAGIELADGLRVETVLMRHGDNRNTVCVSSQVGCALNCSFCATGMMGFKRNLSAWEIVEQVIFFARFLKGENEKVSNIVFMGMGEPFLNYENVITAVRVLNDKDGFNLGARNYSISTAGIIDGIERLSDEDLQINLAISIHAPDNETRSKLMPMNRKYPIEGVLEAVTRYTQKTNRQVMFEYMLIKDINDSEEQAERLAKIAKGRLYMVNLISYNPTGSFQPAPAKKMGEFKNLLERRGVKVTRRHSFGSDIKSACGQLAGEF